MCDQKDISLDAAAQVVAAALQSRVLELPRMSPKQKSELIENRAKVLFDVSPSLNSESEADFRRQATREIDRMGMLLEATYIRAMIYAIAGKELPDRK